jgi:hypothetical protein
MQPCQHVAATYRAQVEKEWGYPHFPPSYYYYYHYN